jgi:hypothetical protein
LYTPVIPTLGFFFGGTGVSTKGLRLVRQALHHMSHSLSPNPSIWEVNAEEL